VQKFAQGDYPQRVLVHSRDEIGQLGIAFNQMADTIISSMEKIRQNDVLRRELIANISHDLRSPLASIQGYLETVLMKESTLSLEQRRRFLNTVYHNVSMLSRLVNELFELSKLDARQVEPQTEPFSLAELAQDLILEFQPQAEEKRIRLHPPNSPNLPFVYADIGMIERALSNLLENALRYTPEGGDVTVKLTPLENSVQVCVQDNGQGISPEDLPFIFDRFYRADKSRAKNASSAGLGLAIAQKILEAHNSQICVQSEINTGTTFTFELPAYKPV
ncbi:MAG: HAMP domain-containing sensor histidine kinase, partial [bacterium]|nr:HAMP domain-containing sensor histidine kinase [bacterium]